MRNTPDNNTSQHGVCNLVFLIDVSGSMSDNDKLPLLKRGLQMMLDELTEADRVTIVTYAGEAGLALETTSGDQSQKLVAAIDALNSGGSTNGGAGIQLAYQKAKENFIKHGSNRVILATDGDLNVGVTDNQELVDLIREQADAGTFLTVLGFGTGNLNDSTLEYLADNGNGIYGYVDSLREARKLLVEQATGSLVTIAKDVKIQVEFNPAEVASYRLIGYENRVLANADFNNDKRDAGDIGAGHHSRFTVLADTSSALAVSSTLSPAKKRSRTTSAIRGSCSSKRCMASSRAKISSGSCSTPRCTPLICTRTRSPPRLTRPRLRACSIKIRRIASAAARKK